MSTRVQIRESIVEDWLAEVNSTFYSDAVLNAGIDWAYRRVSHAMGGVDARWDASTTITAPYEYSLPRDLITLERVTYNPAGPTGAAVTELTRILYDDMFVTYGRQWIDDGAGTPLVMYIRGWRTYGIYPRASTVITDAISLFGRALPASFASDSAEALTPQAFDDGIAAGAFVYVNRRLTMQNGTVSPNFQEALAEWNGVLQSASRFTSKMGPRFRVAGSVPRNSRDVNTASSWRYPFPTY